MIKAFFWRFGYDVDPICFFSLLDILKDQKIIGHFDILPTSSYLVGKPTYLKHMTQLEDLPIDPWNMLTSLKPAVHRVSQQFERWNLLNLREWTPEHATWKCLVPYSDRHSQVLWTKFMVRWSRVTGYMPWKLLLKPEIYQHDDFQQKVIFLEAFILEFHLSFWGFQRMSCVPSFYPIWSLSLPNALILDFWTH